MTHFESTFVENDLYEKQTIKSESIKINDSDDSDFYGIKKIIVKRKMYSERKY